LKGLNLFEALTMIQDGDNDGPMGAQKKKAPQGQKNNYIRHLGFGFELAGVVGLFAFFGFKADEKFETKPLFTLIGLFTAFTGMMYQLMKDIVRDSGNSDKK
jgi:F0F1-type ATP synthase assembly protein I